MPPQQTSVADNNGVGLRRSRSSTDSLSNHPTDESKEVAYTYSRSRLLSLINWLEVGKSYLPQMLKLLVAVLVMQIAHGLYEHRFDLSAMLAKARETPSVAVVGELRPFLLQLGVETTLLGILAVWWLIRRERPVFLLDFATFEAPEEWKVSHEQLISIMRNLGCYTPDSVEFMERILSKSGTGQATAWPPGIIRCLKGLPQDTSVEASRHEATTVMFDVVRKVLRRTGVKPKEIDFLIVNCSLFSPTPSLCTMVCNEFKLRPTCRTYNLSGMGCSAGIISIDLAAQLMNTHPNSTALVVSTEVITDCLYHGNERSMLLQNTLFRCGGAAMILSNKWRDATRAQMKLLHTVRMQMITEESVSCVYEQQDSLGNSGVALSKEIVKVAGRAMEQNLTRLGPKVLPVSEQAKVVASIAYRHIAKALKPYIGLPKMKPYIPDFKRAVDHFCIHAGGRGVIDGIEKNLNLMPRHTEPSRHTLYHYGNTSSSSIWYEMDYVRRQMDLRRGQRVLQLAFGSGFKCTSAVWLSLRSARSITRDLEASEQDQ